MCASSRCSRSAATVPCSPAAWRKRWACAECWFRPARACSPPSACSTPRSSTTTAGRCAVCCASATWARSSKRGRRSLDRRPSNSRPRAFAGPSAALRRSAALHYQGQTYELTVAVPDGPMDQKMVSYLEEAFGREHEKTYGHRAGPDEPVELVTIQVVGQGIRAGRVSPSGCGAAAPKPRRRRQGRRTSGPDTAGCARR